MTPAQTHGHAITALTIRLTALADDELILGHRASEWTGHAPILEEDIALANISQDELGHAIGYYQLRQLLDGSDPDELAYFRNADAFLNIRLLEQPNGDWAYTMLRQYLYDSYEALLLERLEQSNWQPLAELAAKIRREEIFHLRHSALWVERLGLGTTESHHRLQRALDAQWSYAQQLFVPLPGDADLVTHSIFPDLSELADSWRAHVRRDLENAGLTLPDDPPYSWDRTHHGEHLTELLADMQLVARADPEASW